MTPRLKTADVLNANRTDWAKWSQTDGLLRKVRKRLARIIENESSDKDAIQAAKLLLEYDLGRPSEAREPVVAHPLVVFLPQPDGSYQQLSTGRRPIDIEVNDGVEETAADASAG